MKRKKINKLVAGVTAWMLVVQLVMPPALMAEELIVPEQVIAQESEALPEASPSPEPSPEPSSELETGDAVAAAAATTEVNTTSLDSVVETEIINVATESGDIVPFALTEEEEASETGQIELAIDNQATVAAGVEAVAETGNNTQTNETGGETEMQTGDAIALSNSLTLVNTTLIDSQLEVGVINVFSAWGGDLILDPMTMGSGVIDWGAGIGEILIDNTGNIVVTTTATATTGNNSQTGVGETQLETGSAAALSSSVVIAGLTAVEADILQLLIQNLWLWTGQIYNWEYPGSVTSPQALMSSQPSGGEGCSGECEVNLTVANEAEVVVSTTATANTGNNTQVSSGSATMSTGNALASATSTTLVNTTLINSRMRLLQMLLFDEWSGNLIFAYPDLALTIQAPSEVREGEEIPYLLTVANLGYKKAIGISYEYLLTNDEHEVGQDQRLADELLPGETLTWQVSFPTEGRGGHTVTMRAAVSGENPEVTTGNNTSQVGTRVIAPGENAEQKSADPGEDREIPQLWLEGGNNAQNGVYPGDGVRNDWQAHNLGPITAHEVMFVQEFYTPEGEIISQAGGPVGEIALNRHKAVSFVMTPAPSLAPGDYYTLSYLVGQSEKGTETKSNVIKSEIRLLSKLALVGTVQAAEDEGGEGRDEGQVLGTADQDANSCQDCRALPWYLGILVGSLAYYLVNRRVMDGWKVFRWGLTLPLTAYLGLLLTSGECRQGLLLTESLGNWCRYFLPIAYLGYAGIGAGIRKSLGRFR